MKSVSAIFFFFLAISAYGQDDTVIVPADDHDPLAAYRQEAMAKWEDDIVQLQQLDQTEQHTHDGILLIGSSSIRLWESAAVDMTPYRVIRRGYGGAKYSDLAVFAERLIYPHRYRAMVMFVANDVAGNPNDHTPDEVEKLVRMIVDVSHQHQPKVPVLIVEVTPTLKRLHVWPQIRQVNARLREIALSTPDTYFVATAGHYLNPDGRPRENLFREDLLHLNQDGYALWSDLIRRRLDEVFRLMANCAEQNVVESLRESIAE